MKTGFECFRQDDKLHQKLKGKRLAFLGSHASVDEDLNPSLDYLIDHASLNITCVFSPQHGWNGVEQANMIPSDDSRYKGVPVYSLYQDERRQISSSQKDKFDVLVVDLQDVGCRIYTYLTTLLYVLQFCSQHKKSLIVLDRPNPAGRIVEGSYLNMEFQSMVGAWDIPIRHGMTLGELALSYVQLEKINLDLQVIAMKDYNFLEGHGWPSKRSWVLSSPNMPDLESVRCYAGTVLLEGTQISEGRGTCTPLKVFGFPNMDTKKVLDTMGQIKNEWLEGCLIRECHFKPTFDKYKDQLCSGFRIYADNNHYQPEKFKPYRLIALFLKSVGIAHPEYQWKLNPPYEYEYKKWPIDILSGDSYLREWIEDPKSQVIDLDSKLRYDEQSWIERSKKFYLY